MSLVVWCVDIVASPIVVREFFLEFLKVDDTSGEWLFNKLTKALDTLTLNIDDIRGQGYDNRSNMRGKHKGIQKRLLQSYRETGFDEALFIAKEIANEMEIEAAFREKRTIRRKKHFDENDDEEMRQSTLESFKVGYFYYIIDQSLSSIQTRFEQFKKYEEDFGFLFDLKKLRSANNESLIKYCMNLENLLKDVGAVSDINGADIYCELRYLKVSIPAETKRAVDVLSYLKQMDGCYPNAWIAYKILLTIPFTVASAERSFSNLKLIKSYLRSTMSHDRLNDLTMLSIEKTIIEKLDYSSLIETFAGKNARRVVFE